MKQKLFSIFFALALLLPVSTQAQRTQHVSRTSRIEKSPMVINNIKGNNNAIQYNTIQLSGVSAQKETSQANSGTPAPRQNAPGKDVSPIKRAFPSFNSFQQTDGEDEGQTFSWSNTTVTQSGSQFIVSAVEDLSSYVIQSEVYLYTDGTTNYLPSGDYELSTSLSEWTLGASTALNAIRTYGGYVDWYSNGVFYIYCIGRDAFALVHNPNHSSKPMYLLMVGEDMTYDYYWTTQIGTEPNKRTVTFTWGNNGTEDGNDYEADIDGYICSASGDSYTVYEQTVITLTPQPKAGYRFVSWTGTGVNEITNNGDGTYRLQMNGKNYSIAAVFEEIPPVDVTLSPNGGSGSNQIVSAMNGTAMPSTLKGGGSIVAPTRTGYVFGGYVANTNGTGKQYYNANLTSANTWDKDVAATIYAKWTAAQYNITYKDQGNANYSGNNAGSLVAKHTYGTTTTLVAGVKDGYTFGGWYTDAECTVSAGSTIGATDKTADFTLYAKWTQNTYHLNLTSGGNGTVSRSDDGTSSTDLHTGEHITLSYTPASGYAFTGWTGNGSSYVTNNVFTVPNGTNGTTYTVQANFAPTHTITVSADPVAGGTVSGGGTYGEGANVTLTATPNSGYSFSRWSDGNTSNPRNVTMGNADATYTAEFLQQLYDFEYRFTWSDMVSSECGQKYSSSGYQNKHYVLRTKVMKNTNSNPGLRIDMVTSQSSNKSQGYKTYNNSVKLPYPATYTSTVSSVSYNNRGKVITSASSGTYVTQVYDENGTAYTLSNLTNGKVQYKEVTGQTYPFVYVKGNFNNKTVFATIGVAPTYTVTLNSQRSGVNATTSGTTSVTATYTYNTYTPSSITIPTLTGYTFGGYWTGNGGTGTQIIDADGNFIADVSGYTDALKRWFYENNITLYAKWTANTYTITLNNQSATTAGTASVSATFDASTNLTSAITKPTKTGLNFGGYYTGTNGAGVQIIDADGNFVASAGGNSTYLDGSKKWKYANDIELYARWYATSRITINEYTGGTVTVYYNYSGAYASGSSFSSGYRDIEVGTDITITASNAAHYSLTSLYYEGAGDYISSGAEHEVEGNAYVEAVFTGDSYSITYRDQNSDNTFSGTQIDAPATHTYGTATTLKIPTREGYTFGGWFTAKNCASGAVGNTTAASLGATDYTGNITLYAKWTAITYAITYNKGANGTGTIAAGEKTYGVDFTLSSSTFTREGYTQTGWSTSDDGAKDYNMGGTYTANAAIELFPFWTVNTYQVSFDAGDGSGAAMANQNFTYGETKALSANTYTGPAVTITYDYNGATGGDSPASHTVNATFDGWTDGVNDYADEAEVFNLTATNNDVVELTAEWAWTEYITLPTPTKTGYTFYKWTGVINGMNLLEDAGTEFYPDESGTLTAQWNIVTYNLTYNGLEGATHSNPATYNIETATITLTDPSARTGYTFTGWTSGGNTITQIAVGSTGDKTITANWTVNSHTLTWNANGGTLTGGTAAGSVAYGTSLTAPTATREGYSFAGWSPEVPATMPDADATYTAQWNTVTYNLTYNGLNGASNSNPATYTIETATFALANPGERAGYTFTGWTCGGTPITQITLGSTGDKTLTANWTKATTLTLLDNEDDPTYYNNIKALGDVSTLTAEQRFYTTVTYRRSAAYATDGGNARWYTICLPFDADEAQLNAAGLLQNIYEFRYASGSADVGDQVSLHFRRTKSITAGQGYLVKVTTEMAQTGPDFNFANVTLNTSADTESNINNLKGGGYKASGEIEIVGVLRKGTLAADGKKVMGLANNMIWYPHNDGNPMPAYRAYFYTPNPEGIAPRVRIVVEGEDATELEVVDGDRINTIDSPVRKYMENGMLIIELNGIRYNGQGQRL